ncbi:MAG: class I adenylate-forming enzyme family protein [Candidatus Neomarinimicrobiota bacterium]
MIPYPSIRSLLESQVRRYGDRSFVISSSEGSRTKLSYNGFSRRVSHLAALLQSEGLAHGDRIAIPAGNGIQTLVEYFAIWMMGCVGVPVNATREERNRSSVRRSRASTVLFEMKEGLRTVHGFRTGRKSKLRDDVLIVLRTDNRGNLRGIVLSHYNILVNAMAIAGSLELTDDQTVLCTAPLSGVTGIVGCIMSALYAGCRIVLGTEGKPDFLLKLIDREGVHLAFADAQLLTGFLGSSGFRRKNSQSTFKCFVSSHRHLAPDITRKVERKFNVRVIPGFEIAEATCFSSFPPLSFSQPESTEGLPVGTALHACEMTVLDGQGEECSEGQTGWVAVRGHHVMKGYLDDEKATAHAFRFGWLDSGERGFYEKSPDGVKYFTVTGRK